MNHIIRLNQVKQICGLSRSSIYAAVKRGDFPAPISLGARAIGWLSNEVENWINTRGSNRTKAN
jgi:prophage regulatory protein